MPQKIIEKCFTEQTFDLKYVILLVIEVIEVDQYYIWKKIYIKSRNTLHHAIVTNIILSNKSSHQFTNIFKQLLNPPPPPKTTLSPMKKTFQRF